MRRICVPPRDHLAVAAAALADGRHVLVETSPIALSLDEADALVEEAAGRPLVAAMGFNLRCPPPVSPRVTWCAAGRWPRPAAAYALVGRAGGDRGRGAWRRRPDRGGGVLFELASHHADLWRHLLDDEIVACEAVATLDGGLDEAAVVTARSRGGVLGDVLVHPEQRRRQRARARRDDRRLQLSLSSAGDGPRWHPLSRQGGGVRARAAELGGTLADLPRQAREARRGGTTSAPTPRSGQRFERAVRGEPVSLCRRRPTREALRLVLAARASALAGEAARA